MKTIDLPIDPKYGVRIVPTSEGSERVMQHLTDALEARLVKLGTDDVIPPDEPVMIFRGRDRLAVKMIEFYRELSLEDGCTAFHLDGIDNRLDAFETFALEHPDRMKQPGITEGR